MITEPELTCPGIDDAISLTRSKKLKDALERVRFENSNMRYSLWHVESELTTLRAENKRLRDALATTRQSTIVECMVLLEEKQKEKLSRLGNAEPEAEQDISLAQFAYALGVHELRTLKEQGE